MRDLTRSSTADAHWLQEQMDELEGRWEAVCKLSVSKQDRLEAALQQVVLTDNKEEVQRPDTPGKNIVCSCT